MKSSLRWVFVLGSFGALTACESAEEGSAGGSDGGSTASIGASGGTSTGGPGTTTGGTTNTGDNVASSMGGGSSGTGDGTGGTSGGGVSGGSTGSEGGSGGPDIDPVPPEPTVGCGGDTNPGSGAFTINVNGTDRYYRIDIPANYDSNTEYKLVFVFHGLGGTADGTADGFNGFYKYQGLLDQADDDAIFVAGQGLASSSGGAGWDNDGDIDFITQALEDIRTGYCIDNARIFVSGGSFGGIMSNRGGCAMGDDIRAIAPVMGNGPDTTWATKNDADEWVCSKYGEASCTGDVAAWVTHGRADPTVAFCLGEWTLEHWLEQNGCSDSSTANGVGECVEYSGCATGYPVVWCPTDLAHSSPDYAPAEIWKFFSRF